MSDWLDMMMAAANPASYDLYGTAKHVKETAIENAIGSILFSVAGDTARRCTPTWARRRRRTWSAERAGTLPAR